MKDYKDIPIAIKSIGAFVLVSNIGILLYIFIDINLSDDFGKNCIWGVITFIMITILNIFTNRIGKRVAEISSRFTFGSMSVKSIRLEQELSNGKITEEELINRKLELREREDFLNSLAGSIGLVSLISKIIFFCLMAIISLLLILNQLNVLSIKNSYIEAIMLTGIISQFLLFLTPVFSLVKVSQIIKKK
jgi:flagellar biosynthesis component FlhA